jgi:hypothetical protein
MPQLLPHRSRAFGLVIDSNVPIPGLEHSAVQAILAEPVQMQLHAERSLLDPGELAAAQVVHRTWAEDDGQASTTLIRDCAAAAAYHIAYADGTEFLVDYAGTRVRATWPASATLSDTATYLLGPVIAFLLRLRGLLALHGSVVEVQGSAVMFVGHAGQGKSTTAAAFAVEGHGVLTDDVGIVTELDGVVQAVPSYPRVRLWDESVQSLWGEAGALPLLTPNWEKRYLSLGEGDSRFVEQALPLAAIFLLDDRSEDPGAPRMDRLPPLQAFPHLLTHLLTKRVLPHEPADVDFRFVSRLLDRVPVFNLTPHADPARLPALCEAVRTCVGSLLHAPAPDSVPAHV